MNLTEQVKEFVWQKKGKVKNFYGKMTNSSGKVKEFIWHNDILSIGFLTSTVF